MITISVCMIVKDEEKVLDRCLASLRPIADEIIIVDTGSLDATKEIAARYTDFVFDFPWQDDFAAARNHAFSMATKEYIYSADADEVIDGENLQKFLLLKQELLPEIEIVQFLYTNQLSCNTTYNFDTELRPKLYKRLREFTWVDPLHESVRREPLVFDSDITIIHQPETSHGKRDFRIYRKAVEESQGLSVHLQGMYARELFIAGETQDFLEAEGYFEQLIEQEGISNDRLMEALCVLARAAEDRKDTDNFFRSVLKAFALGNPPSEICYLLGKHFEAREDYFEACIWYYNAAYETEPQVDIRLGNDFALDALIRCKKVLGEDYKAIEFEKSVRGLV